jgi:hypothetical protein
MLLRRSYVAVLLGGVGAAASIATAPLAAADGADQTIADLQAQGYLVQINWTTGYATEPLSICTVTGINNPNHSGAKSSSAETVYVDVACPNHPDE